MPEFESKPMYIHRVNTNRYAYSTGKKLLDLVSLASAPSLRSSNTTYGRIQKKLEFEKKHDDKLKNFKLNGFDEHLFYSSQQNKGILTQKVIEDYAKTNFISDEARTAFLDYTKSRLGYLAYLGLLNDITQSNKIYEEKIVKQDGIESKEHTVKIRVNYRYEVNSNFYKYLLEYQKQKKAELKEKFEFGKFDAFIYNFLQKNKGIINIDDVKKERIQQATDNSDKIIYQARLMKELGYLEEKAVDTFTFSTTFKKKLENEEAFLNTAENKIVEFIERHGIFSLDKYRIDREIDAENYTGILKNRLEKLIKLDFLSKSNDKYSFTHSGEVRLKAHYAENYEFTSFDRNILNSNKDGIIDLEEIETELENRYGSSSAVQTLERQKERLFVMECAGIIKRETDNIFSLTGKGTYIIDEENRIYTEEKRESLKQTFKYGEDEEAFYELIKSRNGTINPEAEIKLIMDSIDKEKGIHEFDAYNMLMRNYKCLGTADIDTNDEVKIKVKLGYITQNEDGTLSLTVKR